MSEIEDAIPHLDGACTVREVATVEACREVFREVERATRLHGPMHSFHESYSVILEELDEFWEQVKINPKKLSPESADLRLREIRKELIQTAAMCVRAVVDSGL